MPLNNAEEQALVHVGPGTPSGELFRRYWLPVEASANLGGMKDGFGDENNPLRVRVLGEDLVLFRDAAGRPGLLAEHCSHRGTSLYYGRVEGECLRCLYHGWVYDREGQLVEVPSEPPDSNFKYTVRHQAYPCVEVAGLIFAYLGPPEKKPSFPRYEQLFREDGVRVTGNAQYVESCNVFQALHDNALDIWHVYIAHGLFKGTGRDVIFHHGRDGEPATQFRYIRTPWGTRYVMLAPKRDAPSEYYLEGRDMLLPSLMSVRSAERGELVEWAVPVDDHHTRWFTVRFWPFASGEPTPEALRALENPGFNRGNVPPLPADWIQQVGRWNNFDHPWRPGTLWEDEVAQTTQGSLETNYFPDWEKWHLVSADAGWTLNREVWREQIDRVAEGLDPVGVVREQENSHLMPVGFRNFDNLSWDEGFRLFNMSSEEHVALIASLAGETEIR